MEDILASVPESSLLSKLSPQLSRHLLFPLIEFEEGQAREHGDDDAAKRILEAKLKLLESTNMTDYVANLYCQVRNVSDPPQELVQRRQAVIAQMEKLESDTAQISDLLTREEVLGGLRSDKVANLEFLQKEHGVCILVSYCYYFLSWFFLVFVPSPALNHSLSILQLTHRNLYLGHN